jgi:hypothetical protein
MKNILITIALLIGTILTTAFTKIQQHPALFYTVIIVVGFLSLALVIMVLKRILHTIQVSLISTLFISTATIILIVLAHYKVLNSIVGVLTGITAGFLMAVSLLRNLGRWAQKSVMFGEVFSFITSYRVKGYIDGNRIIPEEDKLNFDKERGDLIAILMNLKYSSKEAKERADYAFAEVPNANFEDKVKRALQYNENSD